MLLLYWLFSLFAANFQLILWREEDFRNQSERELAFICWQSYAHTQLYITSAAFRGMKHRFRTRLGHTMTIETPVMQNFPKSPVWQAYGCEALRSHPTPLRDINRGLLLGLFLFRQHQPSAFRHISLVQLSNERWGFRAQHKAEPAPKKILSQNAYKNS